MSLFRPQVDKMQGYVPGEQPQETGWVKLNTNENPYPPSPHVVKAVQQAAEGRLNVYPDPLVSRFRELVGELFGVDENWVLPANGSDENLTILVRSFVDPGEVISYPYPSYVLYESLAEIQGAECQRLLLNEDWSWNWEQVQPQLDRTKLLFVPNPNSPSGNRWDDESLLRLIPPKGIMVLDEAYGDFCDEPHQGELLKSDAGERIIMTRTLSKSYSLAGIRFGFALARPELIAGMRKVKDSYNCNTLSIAAAVAAMEDQDWMKRNAQRIAQTRSSLSQELQQLGFVVEPSQANFVWVTHPERDHEEIYQQLKDRKVLVRYMQFPHAPQSLQSGLRITIGTEEEIETFLFRLKEIV